MKVQQIDPMLERTSKTGLAPGGGRYKKKLSYTEKKKLGRKLAKKFDNTKSKKEKQNILKEVRDKGVREMFNKFKEPTGKSLGQTGYTSAGKKPSLDTYEDTGAGLGRKKGGYIKKYAKGGGVRKANYT
jgi:hypothetical protein